MNPATPDNIRDSAALISAVVHCDERGQRAILDHCDKDQTLLCLAAMFAMAAQVATGVDDEGLAKAVDYMTATLAAALTKRDAR